MTLADNISFGGLWIGVGAAALAMIEAWEIKQGRDMVRVFANNFIDSA